MIIKPKQALQNILRSLVKQQWLKFLNKIIIQNNRYDMDATIVSIFDRLSKHSRGISMDRSWGSSSTCTSINTLVDLHIIYLHLDSFAGTTFRIMPTKQGLSYVRQWNQSYKVKKSDTQKLILLLMFIINHHLDKNDQYGKIKHQITHNLFRKHDDSSLSEQVRKSLAGDPDMLDDTLSGTIDYTQASLDDLENQEDLQQDYLESDIKSLLHHVFKQNDHEH